MIHPPDVVKVLMNAVCLLLGLDSDWNMAKWLLGQSQFVHLLLNIDINNLPRKPMEFITHLYFHSPDLNPELVKHQSVGAAHICEWLRGLVMYDCVARELQEVNPMRNTGAPLQTERTRNPVLKPTGAIPVQRKSLGIKQSKLRLSKSKVNFEAPTASSVLKKQKQSGTNPLSTLLRK